MEVIPGIHRIRLPMVNNPLRYVNSYLLKDGDDSLLVDCGWNTPDVFGVLQTELRGLGMEVGDVQALLVTHFHTDHYGLAEVLVRQAHLRLLMHREDWLFVRTHFSDMEIAVQAQTSWLRRNGLPVRTWTEEENRAVAALRRLPLVAPDTELEEGDQIRVGRHCWQVVWTPGHAQGHICLYDAERRVLLSGDHVLDPITPTVNITRLGVGNPLSAYRSSLQRVAALDVDLVLPGHGKPFAGLGRRVSELLAHHDQREMAALDALSRGPATGAEIAGQLAWTRGQTAFSQLPAFQQQMALSETLAHLEHLKVAGRVSSAPRNGCIYFERSPTAEKVSPGMPVSRESV